METLHMSRREKIKGCMAAWRAWLCCGHENKCTRHRVIAYSPRQKFQISNPKF